MEVSIGEALDKYSILEIKEKYIASPEKLFHVRKEKETIYPVISSYLEQCPLLYSLLEKVNTKIWFLVDDTRDKDVSYRTIMKENDARFRVKRKINDICNSNLKEQKNFTTKPYLVYIDPYIVCSEKVKEWICEVSMYHDALYIYTPFPEQWITLQTEDPDIQVFHAEHPPEGCDWIIEQNSLTYCT